MIIPKSRHHERSDVIKQMPRLLRATLLAMTNSFALFKMGNGIKAFSIAFALLGLLSSCSENKDPALIERKRSVFQATASSQSYQKEESKINHGAISESQISEQSITQHEDVYQNEDLSKKDEIKEVFDDEYADLSDIEKPAKQIKSVHYKTAHPLSDQTFIWPVDGEVTSSFGNGNGISHEGIIISVPEGTKVKAAADGKVILVKNSDEIHGNLVIIEHKNNVRTAYAYNSKVLVSKNDHVSKGVTIALSGKTGQATSPQLYFATSKNGVTVDPEKAM